MDSAWQCKEQPVDVSSAQKEPAERLWALPSHRPLPKEVTSWALIAQDRMLHTVQCLLPGSAANSWVRNSSSDVQPENDSTSSRGESKSDMETGITSG